MPVGKPGSLRRILVDHLLDHRPPHQHHPKMTSEVFSDIGINGGRNSLSVEPKLGEPGYEGWTEYDFQEYEKIRLLIMQERGKPARLSRRLMLTKSKIDRDPSNR